MNEPINHHYNPVFCLKQWCDDDGKIVRYYRPYKQVVASPISPERTGFEPHLYALRGFPDDQKQWIERHYMGPAVDGPASEALKVLLASGLSSMTPKVKVDWTRFLMSLTLRDPDTVSMLNADMRRALSERLVQNQEWFESYCASGDEETFFEWVEKNIPSILSSGGTLYLPDFIDNVEIGNLVLKMRWSTFDLSGGGITLLTSDRPLIRTHGLKDPRCIVMLPLSPGFVFVATNSAETDRGLRMNRPERVAKDINARIVAQAKRYVYGADRSHLRFIENRLRPHEGCETQSK